MTKNITPNSELAAYLSAILKNPACPAALYNSIADHVSDMSSHIATDDAEYIERALDAYGSREAKRKGEQR